MHLKNTSARNVFLVTFTWCCVIQLIHCAFLFQSSNRNNDEHSNDACMLCDPQCGAQSCLSILGSFACCKKFVVDGFSINWPSGIYNQGLLNLGIRGSICSDPSQAEVVAEGKFYIPSIA